MNKLCIYIKNIIPQRYVYLTRVPNVDEFIMLDDSTFAKVAFVVHLNIKDARPEDTVAEIGLYPE